MHDLENNSSLPLSTQYRLKRKRRPAYKPGNIQSCDNLKPVTFFDDELCMQTTRIGSLVEGLMPKAKNSLLIQITKLNTTSSFCSQKLAPPCALSNYQDDNHRDTRNTTRRYSLKSNLKKYAESCLSERMCIKAKAFPTNMLEPCRINRITPRERPMSSYRSQIGELVSPSRSSFRTSQSKKTFLNVPTPKLSNTPMDRKRVKIQVKQTGYRPNQLQVKPWNYEDQQFSFF